MTATESAPKKPAKKAAAKKAATTKTASVNEAPPTAEDAPEAADEKAAEKTGEKTAAKPTNGLGPDEKLPIKMLNDRILVNLGLPEGERRTTGGILIPATAQVGKRLAWGEIVAAGPNVRAMEAGDQVLFNPEDRYEVEVRGSDYIILRERDVHAVAAERLEEGSTGLYL